MQFFPFVLSLSHSAGYVPIRLLRRKYVKIATMLWYVINCSSLSLYLFLLALACSLVRSPSSSRRPYTCALVLVISIIRATIYTHTDTDRQSHIVQTFIHWTVTKTCAYEATCCFSSSRLRDVVCAHEILCCVCVCGHSFHAHIHTNKIHSILLPPLLFRDCRPLQYGDCSYRPFTLPQSNLSVNTTSFTCLQKFRILNKNLKFLFKNS